MTSAAALIDRVLAGESVDAVVSETTGTGNVPAAPPTVAPTASEYDVGDQVLFTLDGDEIKGEVAKFLDAGILVSDQNGVKHVVPREKLRRDPNPT